MLSLEKFNKRKFPLRVLATSALALSMVAGFGIAHADDGGGGEMQLLQGGAETGRLVHAAGQDHDRAFVENHFQFQTHRLDRLEHCDFMRFHRGHDHPAERHRDTARLQLGYKFFGRRFA